MKKLLVLLMALVLVFTLSGCTEDTTDYVTQDEYDLLLEAFLEQDQDFSLFLQQRDRDLEGFGDLVDELSIKLLDYYTEDELDEGFEDLDLYLQGLNTRILELEDELRDFDRFEYEDLLEFMAYIQGGEFELELEEYLEDYQGQINTLESQLTAIDSKLYYMGVTDSAVKQLIQLLRVDLNTLETEEMVLLASKITELELFHPDYIIEMVESNIAKITFTIYPYIITTYAYYIVEDDVEYYMFNGAFFGEPYFKMTKHMMPDDILYTIEEYVANVDVYMVEYLENE